jgi:hypothetical protein
MALSDLKKRVKPATMETKTVTTAGGDELKFRSPQPTDYFPSPKRVEKLRRDWPRLRGAQLMLVLLMGGCYLRTDEEQGKGSSDADFAEIACNDIELWQETVTAFKGAFPGALLEKPESEEEEEDVPFEISETPSLSGASTSSTGTPESADTSAPPTSTT